MVVVDDTQSGILYMFNKCFMCSVQKHRAHFLFLNKNEDSMGFILKIHRI